MIRFLLGLAAIDAVVIAAIGLPAVHRAASGATPSAAPRGDAGARARARFVWQGVDAAMLGKKTADVYLSARRRIGRNRRVLLIAPKRVGDDVEMRVKLADGKGAGFPPSTYCFHCPMQRCLFGDATATALQTVAEAFRPEEVRALLRAAGSGHVLVSYVGGASGGPVVPKAESQYCDGAQPRTDARVPPAFDIYDDAECGAQRCELAGSGDVIDLGDGYIDDNRKLACLRALCMRAAAGGMGDVPVRFVGELSFEQGRAYRGADVVITLRGIAAPENREGYAAFWTSLKKALQETR